MVANLRSPFAGIILLASICAAQPVVTNRIRIIHSADGSDSGITILPSIDSGITLMEADNGNVAAMLIANNARGALSLSSNGTGTIVLNAASANSYWNTGGHFGFGTATPSSSYLVDFVGSSRFQDLYITSGNSIFPEVSVNSNLGDVTHKWNQAYVSTLEVYGTSHVNSGGTLNIQSGGAFAANSGSTFTMGTPVTGDLMPAATVTYNVGDVSHKWNQVYVSTLEVYGTSHVNSSGTLNIQSGGALSINSGSTFTMNSTVTGDLMPTSSSVYNLGDVSHKWNSHYVNTLEIYGTSHINNGGTLNVQSGGAIAVNSGGSETAASGSTVNWNSGATVNINATLTGHVLPTSSVTYNLGDVSHKWNQVYTSTLEVYGTSHINNGGTLNVQSGGTLSINGTAVVTAPNGNNGITGTTCSQFSGGICTAP